MSRRDSVVAALLAALVTAVALRHGLRVLDDAYIGFRYAANLATGAGLVFNPGERVLGTSSPLYALLLAFLSKLSGSADIPRLASLVAVGAVFVLIALSYGVARRFATPLFASAAVLAAFAEPVSLWIFASGLETPLYLLGIAGSLAFLNARKDGASLFVAGLLPFLHPDGVLLFPAVVFAMRRRDGTWPVRRALLNGLPALAFAGALALVYGSPVPQSVVTKSRAFVAPPFHAPLALLGTFKATLFPFDLLGDRQRELGDVVSPGKALTYLIAAALLLAGARGVRAFRLAPAFSAIALFSAGFGLSFAVMNPLLQPWYLLPFRLGVALLIAGAMSAFAATGARSARVGVAWALIVIACGAYRMIRFAPYDPEMREGIYRRAVENLALVENDVVAAPEIGALGYFTKARIFDTVGLVTPRALLFYDEKWRDEARQGEHRPGAIPPALLREIAPGFIISGRVFLRDAEKIDPAALASYEELTRYDSPVFPDGGVVVLRRH